MSVKHSIPRPASGSASETTSVGRIRRVPGERRQIGEQFRLLEPARLPERPVGPSRLAVNATGALAGLGLGLVLVATRGRSTLPTSN